MELQELCAGAPGLRRLRLGRNALQPACLPLLLRALKAAPAVTTLALQDCKLTAEDLLPLAAAMQDGSLALEELDITYNPIGTGPAADALMATLGAAPSLAVLHMSSTGVDSDAVAAFADARALVPCSRLRTLWLNRNPLTLRGLGHAVRAVAQPVSAAGSPAAAAAACELQVQWCIPAGPMGAVHDLLEAATGGDTTRALHVGTLDMKGCVLGEEGVRSVVHALRRDGSAHGLSASHVSLFGVAAGNAGVQHLVEHLLEHKGEHSDLGVLDVGGNDLTDEAADVLSKLFPGVQGGVDGAKPPLNSLRVLDISANDLSEDGVAAVQAALSAAGTVVQLLHAGQGEKRRETQEGDDSLAAAAAQGAASPV